MMSASSKFQYFLWSALRVFGADTRCPSCGSDSTSLIRRKYLVTSLYRCTDCYLMFRVPKGDPTGTIEFYQSEYTEGITTDCPSREQLESLKKTRFAGTEKDFSRYIEVLKAAGLREGASVLDFGCSWGYGSWQMRQAGFEVYSYEISKPRAMYAEAMLGCSMVTPDTLPTKVDCIFSSHVIEHLENPQALWDVARRVVRPGGTAVVFMPNGDLTREGVHLIWGRVHPLLIDATAIRRMAERSGFAGHPYTSPYPLHDIAAGRSTDALNGGELAIVSKLAVAAV